MELISQHAKKIMEECKVRARDAGLKFDDETLEYIVTNRDMIHLSPKIMIPTLYDYWVHDLHVIQGNRVYDVFPHNPYETVINTRPAISFYNDNNPDWLNVMIFYHVLAHIDFFQNNNYFRNTWKDDFTGKALADKRLIERLRLEKGSMMEKGTLGVDYLIEFCRGIDNLVGFYDELNKEDSIKSKKLSKLDFYFDFFLQGKLDGVEKVPFSKYQDELDRYNQIMKKYRNLDEARREVIFFAEVIKDHPEFGALYEKTRDSPREQTSKLDLMKYVEKNSEFLNKPENEWMKLVLNIVRDTSLYFQPQIRDKIMNEGWASYWHEKLFMQDERVNSHEVEFCRTNAYVMSMPQVGLNPYALGWRLFMHIEESFNRGKFSYDFDRLKDANLRKNYDTKQGGGLDFIFKVRKEYNDFTFINEFVTQEFMDKYKLFVVGQRVNWMRGTLEYFIKSKKVEDYKKMLIDTLYHPPYITIDESKKGNHNRLYLCHHFEGKPLIEEWIPMTLIGLEQLWGNPVAIETYEMDFKNEDVFLKMFLRILEGRDIDELYDEEDIVWKKVLHSVTNKKYHKKYLDGK